MVTQCLLLIKPHRKAEWEQVWWVLDGVCCAWRIVGGVVAVVVVDVLVTEANKGMRK